MSISTIHQVMLRIKGATPASPIAVFKCKESKKLLTVFARTQKTRQQINAGIKGYIGSYYNGMDLVVIKKHLKTQMEV